MRRTSDIMNVYDSYPLGVPRDDLDSCDLMLYHSRLRDRARQLFVENESASKIEVREYLANGEDENRTLNASISNGNLSPSRFIATEQCLQDVLKVKPPLGSTRIITIHRMNSWSRLKITLDMFKFLCGSCQVNPHYLSFVEGMGFKSGPDDEHFMSCHSHLSSRGAGTKGKEAVAFDICYNVRHFESHGRDLEDPWSSRTSAVHHRYEFRNRSSEWIVIQPPALWRTALDDVRLKSSVHPLALHLRYISSAIENNREYLDYMSKMVLKLDQLVSFPKPLSEFEVDFSLSQNVHTIRRKLHHLKMILEGTIRTVAAVTSLAEDIQMPTNTPQILHEAFLRELSSKSLDLNNYKSTTDELLNLSNDIKSTINSILNFRNQELLNRHSIQLQRIAENEATETKAMGQISRWMYNDSRTMRIATVIAMIYLPASLVLSFFSTVFVEFSTAPENKAVDAGPEEILVHGQLWIAVVSITVLVLGTTGAFWIWDHRKVEPLPASC